MDWGTARVAAVGARFGEREPEDFAGLFAEIELDEAEQPPFGPLDVLTGWVGHSGPGAVFRVQVHADCDRDIHRIELRLRTNGRYIRSRLKPLADRHGDLTLTLDAAPVVYGFVPYAALAPAVGEVTVEVWLVEDEEPIEEALYALQLPNHDTRRIESALAAVVLALISVIDAPADVGVTASGAVEGAVATLFELDAAGRAWAGELVADAEAETETVTAARLRAHVAPGAVSRVLVLLAKFARTKRGLAFVNQLTSHLGVPQGRTVRGAPGRAADYATLGLTPGATREEIRAAFHKAAAAVHPDVVPEAERDAATQTMARLNEAYTALRRR